MSTAQLEQPVARCSIESIDPRTAKQWHDAGEAVLVDVREPGEFRSEHIPGAVNLPLSQIDPAALPDLAGRKLIVHCRTGSRAKQACNKLRAAAAVETIYNAGGIEQWKQADLATEKGQGGAIDIVRQVHIVVGSAVLIGSILAATVSPWFLILTGFFGAGLLFAGATGFCGMAMMLAKMPWNR